MAITFDQYDSSNRSAIKAVFGNRKNWQRFCVIEHRLSLQLYLKSL